MVDVSGKDSTERTAVAEGRVVMRTETLDIVLNGNAVKGDVLGAARIAGIMAAKRTHQLIPLCHPLTITKVAIDIEPDHRLPGFIVQATVKVTGQTGVEMGMRIDGVRLLEKTGGKSGSYRAEGYVPREQTSKG